LKKSSEKIFPFSYNNVNKVWTTALRKTRLLERDEETKRLTIRLHNLRKYFSTRGKWSDRDIPAFFQGHSRGIKAIYQRYDQAEELVRVEYLKAIPSLTIEEYSDTGKVEELESKLNEEKLQRQSTNQNLNYLITENRELKTRILVLEQEAQNLKQDTGYLRQETRLLKLEIENYMRKIDSKIEENEKLRFNINKDGTIKAQDGDPIQIIEILSELYKQGIQVNEYKINKVEE
jgi:hypothetical protein